MNEAGFDEAVEQGEPVTRDVVVLSDPDDVLAPIPRGLQQPDELLRPVSPWCIVLASLGAVLLLGLVGLGWSQALVTRSHAAFALAPAMGAAVLLLAGLVVDRVGIRLTGFVPLLGSAAVGVGGYALGFRRGRVEQEPVLDR